MGIRFVLVSEQKPGGREVSTVPAWKGTSQWGQWCRSSGGRASMYHVGQDAALDGSGVGHERKAGATVSLQCCHSSSGTWKI